MPKTDYSKYLGIALSISYILFSLLVAIHFWCFNESFYRSEHDKIKLYGKSIAEHIGISEDDLDKLTSFTLAYLNDPDASLDIEMEVNGKKRESFTDDEKLHMIDVQRLNLIANGLLVISGIICAVLLFYFIKTGRFYVLFSSYKKVLIYVGFVLAILAAWIIIDFDSFWTMFHHLFFPSNDLWLLDLRKDILIMIVPPEFFNHLVLTIVVTFVVLLAGFYFIFLFLSRKALS